MKVTLGLSDSFLSRETRPCKGPLTGVDSMLKKKKQQVINVLISAKGARVAGGGGGRGYG